MKTRTHDITSEHLHSVRQVKVFPHNMADAAQCHLLWNICKQRCDVK